MYQGEMDVPAEFSLNIIPATYIITRDRKIAFKHKGPADWSHQKVIEYLEALINQPAESS